MLDFPCETQKSPGPIQRSGTFSRPRSGSVLLKLSVPPFPHVQQRYGKTRVLRTLAAPKELACASGSTWNPSLTTADPLPDRHLQASPPSQPEPSEGETSLFVSVSPRGLGQCSENRLGKSVLP